ncbi:MAG: GGDEF domain-containing protein [Elusimicrobiota bacterium]|jgi:diguanylate cyclase (GGDEF)-like protein
MLSYRNLTLLVANLLFFSISAALFFFPGWETIIYPLYGLVFIWTDYRREEEIHVIFLFLSAVSAALCMTRRLELSFYAGICGEAVSLWMISFGLGIHRSRMDSDRRRILEATAVVEGANLDLERETGFYESYSGSAQGQIRLRKDLTQAAKSLGTTMDTQELQLRLQRVLEGRYRSSRVSILPGTPPDPFVQWAVRTQAPVLVRDLGQDERFSALAPSSSFRSALLVPLTVRKKPYGFVRLESDEARVFGADDLRTVDLFATVASLTLENIQLYQDVSEMALHDGLTGLYTQRAFRLRLKDELLRAGRSQSPLSLIMGDIDHFKTYNDDYGHQAGDELLRAFSRLLMNQTRPVDCVARYGGEEFAVILPNVVHSTAVDAAQRIRMAIGQEPFVFQGRRTHVSASFGVSSFPQDATSQSQLVRVADERLYRSKQNGRDQVTG